MKELTQKRKSISYVLKSIVILSAIIGTVLSAHSGRDGFMGGSRVFMFFTTQSNIAIALICLAGCILTMRKKQIHDAFYVIKFVGTVSITLTGVVFVVLLAPTLGPRAWSIQNILTHVVVPVLSVVDFFVVSAGVGMKKRNVFFVIIPPILYAIYAGIGYVRGWEFAEGYNYPYFFLNWGSSAGAFGFSNELPYMGSAWWILALFIFLMLVGYVYLAISDRIAHNEVSMDVMPTALESSHR
ncbi:MAG: Pr6Pr family membrane protein [Lachnospiraceae bacterium]|nr:Pr6Pr family membrane protein [Lachnospiraceae bacterium]